MACPIDPPAGTCGAITASLCPLPPFKTGRRLGEKKAQGQMGSTFLDWALETFSGYVAVDELYEGLTVCSRRSTIGSTNGFSMRFWITIRAMRISQRSFGACKERWV